MTEPKKVVCVQVGYLATKVNVLLDVEAGSAMCKTADAGAEDWRSIHEPEDLEKKFNTVQLATLFNGIRLELIKGDPDLYKNLNPAPDMGFSSVAKGAKCVLANLQDLAELRANGPSPAPIDTERSSTPPANAPPKPGHFRREDRPGGGKQYRTGDLLLTYADSKSPWQVLRGDEVLAEDFKLAEAKKKATEILEGGGS